MHRDLSAYTGARGGRDLRHSHGSTACSNEAVQAGNGIHSNLWLEILERFDKANVALPKPGLDLSAAVDLLYSSDGFVRSLRPQFQVFEVRAKALSVDKS